MAKRCVVFGVLYLACSCHGRRMQRPRENTRALRSHSAARQSDDIDARRPLGSLLFAASPQLGRAVGRQSAHTSAAWNLRRLAPSMFEKTSTETKPSESDQISGEDFLKPDSAIFVSGAKESPIFSSPAAASMVSSSRVQRIKNICANKEIQNVLASCDFALRLEVTESPTKVDFASLIARVDRNINLLRLRNKNEHMTLQDKKLVERLIDTKKELQDALADPERELAFANSEASAMEDAGTAKEEAGEQLNTSTQISKLKWKVREDGSVDWDETLASARGLGAELWGRLNGKEDEDLPSFREIFRIAEVETEEETEEVLRLKANLENKEQDLKKLLEDDAAMKENIRQAKTEGCMITDVDLLRLRRTADRAKELRNLVTLCELNLDMERLCVYLEQDLEDSGQDIADLKLAVAEVGFLERQLLVVMGCLLDDTACSIEDAEESPNVLLSLVDEDDLALIRSKVDDLKTRLGIKGSPPAQIDWGTVGELLGGLGDKIKEGATFYGQGTGILVSDLQYVLKLIGRAIGGYTLKPREVNTVRRTFKDVFTLIPFTIILIIPLSPIGHVLVFSFIQRFFPDAFPSCYTEKRLNLRQLYSDVLKSEEELLGPPPRKPFFKKLQFRLANQGKELTKGGD